MNQQESQNIMVTDEMISQSLKIIDDFLNNSGKYGITPKSRGYAITNYDPNTARATEVVYAHFSFLGKVSNDLEKAIKNYTSALLYDIPEDDYDTYKYTISNNNGQSLLIEQKNKVSQKNDFGAYLYELEVVNNSSIYNNYNEFQNLIENLNVGLSKTNLQNLLKDKGFNEEYIEKNLAPYLEPVVKEQFKIASPIIFNHLDVNEFYTASYNMFYEYDQNGNISYNRDQIINYYIRIKENLKIADNMFKKLKKVLKELEEGGLGHGYNTYMKTINTSEFTNLFYDRQGNEKFILHYLMENFNVNYDEIKEIFNGRSIHPSYPQTYTVTPDIKIKLIK